MVKVIDGKELANEKLKLVRRKVSVMDRAPILVSLVAKEDGAGQMYTQLKMNAAKKVGIDLEKIEFSLTNPRELHEKLDEIVKENRFDGLLIQKPSESLAKQYFKDLKQFKIWWLSATSKIPEKKDVDCLNVANIGLLTGGLIQFYPATVKAVLDILYTVLDESELSGKEVVIVGSSEIVGKPLAMALRNKGASVTLLGDTVKNLKAETKSAEILVSCAGVKNLITKDMVKRGAVVIDVGDKGDVDFERVKKKASYITPVPGGVGPLTVACLMENVIKTIR